MAHEEWIGAEFKIDGRKVEVISTYRGIFHCATVDDGKPNLYGLSKDEARKLIEEHRIRLAKMLLNAGRNLHIRQEGKRK